MCGIFAFLLNNKYKLTLEQRKKLLSESIKIQHRGPDNTIFNEYGNSKVFLLFIVFVLLIKWNQVINH